MKQKIPFICLFKSIMVLSNSYGKSRRDKEAMATPSNYLVCFPKFMCMQFLHHIQELGKHTNPLHNLTKSFHTGRWKLGCGKMFNSLTVQEKPH